VRDIKFRAWSELDGGVMLQVGDDCGTKTGLDCCQYKNQGQDVVLMQFTGLLDKNGVEIYEGDTAESQYFDVSVVKYDDELASFVFGDICHDEALATYPENQWRIVGNIYETV